MLRKKLKLTCNMFPASNPENLPETVLRAGTEIYNYLGSNFKLQTSNWIIAGPEPVRRLNHSSNHIFILNDSDQNFVKTGQVSERGIS